MVRAGFQAPPDGLGGAGFELISAVAKILLFRFRGDLKLLVDGLRGPAEGVSLEQEKVGPKPVRGPFGPCQSELDGIGRLAAVKRHADLADRAPFRLIRRGQPGQVARQDRRGHRPQRRLRERP